MAARTDRPLISGASGIASTFVHAVGRRVYTKVQS